MDAADGGTDEPGEFAADAAGRRSGAIAIRVPELSGAGATGQDREGSDKPLVAAESAAQVIRVSAWLVDVGQRVSEGDRVVELLLPGLTLDVPAPCDGFLLRVERQVNAVVVSGTILGWVKSEP